MNRLYRCALYLAATAALGAAPLAAQTPAPAPQVTVGGLVYAQYLYQDFPTAGVRQNNFSIQRAYINVIGRFAGGIYTRVTMDVYSPPAGTTDNSRTYRLKYAYFGYTPNGSPLTFKLGAIHTPWLDWEEALWDYRVQGQMALERGGYLTSSDFGAGVDYKQGPDKINGQFVIVNGEGYAGGPGDFRKDAEVRLSARVMDTDDSSRVGGLRLTGYAGIGKATGGADRNRFIGMASYRTKQITIAGEFASTKDGLVAVTGSVISAFGVYKLNNSKFAALARLDITDPNTSVANDKQTRIIGGVSCQVSPNLRLLADLDHLSFEAGTTAHNLGLFQAQINF
ncbi:MAG TPA: hypothetical protein VF923_03820 [Gemmatimonadales bacterium]